MKADERSSLQHPVNMYSAKPQVINHFLSPHYNRKPVSSMHIMELIKM